MPNRNAQRTSRPFPHKTSARSTSFTATQAKNSFGQLLEIALRGERVFITKRDTPKAVLLSLQEFHSLADAPASQINDLTSEFDALLERMQRPGQRRKMQAALSTSPKKMGRLAIAAARERA